MVVCGCYWGGASTISRSTSWDVSSTSTTTSLLSCSQSCSEVSESDRSSDDLTGNSVLYNFFITKLSRNFRNEQVIVGLEFDVQVECFRTNYTCQKLPHTVDTTCRCIQYCVFSNT